MIKFGVTKLHRSWWDLILDGKLHHLDGTSTPYGSIASLRSAIYREASERGLKATTRLELPLLYVQATPAALGRRQQKKKDLDPGTSTPAPDAYGFIYGKHAYGFMYGTQAQVAAAGPGSAMHPETMQARAAVLAAGLDPADQDLVDERQHCTCGLGNAGSGQVHDPSCQVWG